MTDLLETREKRITENMGLVHSCAKRFKEKGIEYDDLFQAGCIGLIKAADNFNEDLGYAFSTYAVPVILGEIKQLFRSGGSIKIGRSMKEKSIVILKVREEYLERNGREPTISELADSIGADIHETTEILNASLPPISLTYDEEDGGGQMDIPSKDDNEEKISELIALSEVLNKLSPQDREIIKTRYFEGLTQSATADKLNMSQVQISRKEKKILIFLREHLNK